MALITPWRYALTGTEHAHQCALFMWANMAAKFGLQASADLNSYCTPGHAMAKHYRHSDAIPQLEWLFAIKNAGHGDAIRGNRSRAEGVKAGVPDICLPISVYGNGAFCPPRWHGLFMELKRPRVDRKGKGVVSSEQSKWGDHLLGEGYAFQVCYGWEMARGAILDYLGLSHGAEKLFQVQG